MKKRLLTVIISALIISTSMLAGCGCENKTATADEVTTTVSETHEVSDTSSTTATEATLSKEEQAIVDAGLKVDDKGNITDKNGKKVEVKDGKVEVKTEDGKTVTVSASEVSTANENNNKINTSTSSKSNSTSSKSSATGSSSSKSSSSSKTNSSSSKSSSTSSKTSSSSSSSKPSSNSSSSSSSKTESSKTETHTHTWVNITKQVKVIDQEAYSYEEDVYETQRRAICNECGADISDNIVEHCKAHALNGENGSYSVKSVKVKTGTKTVNVPEQSHYENQTIGRKCSSCGKTEYYEYIKYNQLVISKAERKILCLLLYIKLTISVIAYRLFYYQKKEEYLCTR